MKIFVWLIINLRITFKNNSRPTILNFWQNSRSFNTHAVGRNSWVHLSFNNFLVKISDRTSCKMSSSQSLGLKLILSSRFDRLIIFENSLLKNGIEEFWSDTLITSIPNIFWNNNKVHILNIITTKIAILNFRKKLRKLPFIFFKKIQIMKRDFKKPRNQQIRQRWC